MSFIPKAALETNLREYLVNRKHTHHIVAREVFIAEVVGELRVLEPGFLVVAEGHRCVIVTRCIRQRYKAVMTGLNTINPLLATSRN